LTKSYCIKKRYLSKLAKKSSFLRLAYTQWFEYLYDKLNNYILAMMESKDEEEVMWKIADDYFEVTPNYKEKSRDEIIMDIKFKTSAFFQKSDLMTMCTRSDKKVQEYFKEFKDQRDVDSLKENVLGVLIIEYTENHMSSALELIDEKLAEEKTANVKRLKKWRK
jgi:hypothetical protein